MKPLAESRIGRGLCAQCGKEPLVTAYYGEKCRFSNKERNKTHSKSRVRSRKWRTTNPEAYKASARKQHLKKYGITPEQYNTMLAAQSGLCAICHIKSKGRLSIDHSHRTEEVRALLCAHCNFLIGYARESAIILRAAADYIDIHVRPVCYTDFVDSGWVNIDMVDDPPN